ncbi:MAG: hypothetical protein ACREJC_09700 [Tepidisphaeraceae bacterium]
MNILLGSKVKDRLTGFEGTVIARVDYINGCTQYGIIPRVREDGKMTESTYIDWKRLQVLEEPPMQKDRAALASVGGPSIKAPTDGRVK